MAGEISLIYHNFPQRLLAPPWNVYPRLAVKEWFRVPLAQIVTIQSLALHTFYFNLYATELECILF